MQTSIIPHLVHVSNASNSASNFAARSNSLWRVVSMPIYKDFLYRRRVFISTPADVVQTLLSSLRDSITTRSRVTIRSACRSPAESAALSAGLGLKGTFSHFPFLPFPRPRQTRKNTLGLGKPISNHRGLVLWAEAAETWTNWFGWRSSRGDET